MAWKNNEQHTFADVLFIEHDAIKELDGINDLLNWKAVAKTLKNIHNYKVGELSSLIQK